MTSEIPSLPNFIHKHDEPLLEYCTSNGILPIRLLSPITENSVENLSTSLPLNKLCLDISQKSSNNNQTIDEVNQILLQKIQQYIINFSNIQNYLNTLDQHFQGLSFIIEYLRNDNNLTNIIELFETRLLQMRVKRNQINQLLNHFSIKNLIEQITPFIHQSKLILDYDEFLHSIQLSLNQKTILLDHIQNEYRYRKYQLKENSSKFQQQNQLLIKLTKQIEEYFMHYNRKNCISRFNEHNQQSIEFVNLSNEFEQLKAENDFLILKAKEKIQNLSLFIQSNHH